MLMQGAGSVATAAGDATNLESSAQSGRAVLARRACVWLAVAAYAVFFSIASVLRHETFQSGTFDLAFMDQALWSTLHGHPLGVSIEPHLATSELGYHFEPILFLIAPLYWLYASPIVLLVLQSVALAAGALPASWLAYERLRSNLAATVFALAYLLFPGLQAANMFDFHAFTLSAPLLLFAFYYAEHRRYLPFAVAAALAMATKENVPLTVAMLGFYLIACRRAWRAGLLTVAASAGWFLLATYVVIPAFNNEGQGWLWNRYGGMGGSPLQVAAFLLDHPERLIEPAPGLSNPAYFLQLLLPVAFLSLLHLPTLLLAAPGLATNLLTVYEAMHQLETYHYTASLVPIVVIAAIYGAGTAAAWLGRLSPAAGRRAIWVLAALVLATSLLYHYYRGYTPLSPSFRLSWPDEHHAIGHRLAASIPPTASVSAQFNLAPHVSQRHQLQMFPSIADSEYIFLDVSSQPNTTGFWEGVHDRLREAIERTDYGIVAAEDGYVLLRRGAPHRELPPEFYSFARVAVAAPSHPLRIRFGDALELLGFDLERSRDARVDLTLYWRALQPIAEDLFLAIYLTDGDGKELGATANLQPANYWYPVSRWQPGEVVRLQTLLLPWAPGERDFGLAVGVLRGRDPWRVADRLAPRVLEAGWLVGGVGDGTLAEIVTLRNDRGLVWPEWAPRPRSAGRESPLAQFADRAALVGHELVPAQAAPGESVVVRLDWRVQAHFGDSLTTFVHVLAPGPRVVAQRDSPPLGGRLPTTFWLPGDVINDEYVLSLPSGLAPGQYEVEVGLYDPHSGARLPVAEGDTRSDHVVLPTRLSVTQK